MAGPVHDTFPAVPKSEEWQRLLEVAAPISIGVAHNQRTQQWNKSRMTSVGETRPKVVLTSE
jgi:hypothetical protein